MARQRRNTNRFGRADRDFIGKLPDCVLHHIVSLLPYKEAARTATLSTRWRRVLPSERVVDLDERKLGFLFRGESGFASVTKVLMENYREACIDKFSLTLNVSSPADFTEKVRDFVSFAAEKKAKVMLLDFSRNDDQQNICRPKFDLPKSVYGNSSLETLKLYACDYDPFGFKNCASLLHLSLGCMDLPADSLQSLVEKCPSLKSLSIKKCSNTCIFVIKGRVLESLVIEDCDVDIDNCWIDIQTPGLKFFKYSGNFCNFEVYVTEQFEELVLDFGTESEFEFGTLLYELFKCNFSGVKVMTVCSYVLQTIPSGDEPLGIHGMNVKHLTLKTAMHENECYGIRFFLYSCYSLETLTIEIDPTRRILEDYESPFEENWGHALPVYACLRKTLKVVDVKGYRGTNDERCLLTYFVCGARVMKKLNIEFRGDSGAYLQLERMLQILKSPSPNLQITIYTAN